MASLTEVYEGGNGAGLRRLHAGVALFGVGAVLLVAGIVVAATEVGRALGLGLFEARGLAGVLGGIGLPAVVLGTMTVLPRASLRVRAGAWFGSAVCLAGVALFYTAYPVDWVGGSGDTGMTLVVAGVYFSGALVASWCLFASVASFKARNDPGGTVKLEITKGGETRVVEVSNENLRSHLGGVGLLGGTPDGDVETQTNRPDEGSDRRAETGTDRGSTGADSNRGRNRERDRERSSTRSGVTGFDSSPGVTDGGSAGTDIAAPSTGADGAEFLDDGSNRPVGDTYCGNCTHFRYARTDDGMVPYCGLHGEAMDDMDACEEWTPNTNA